MKTKLLFRPGSLWIGAHWSPQLRQWCVNVVPCVTLRIRLAPEPACKHEWKMVSVHYDNTVSQCKKCGTCRNEPTFGW